GREDRRWLPRCSVGSATSTGGAAGRRVDEHQGPHRVDRASGRLHRRHPHRAVVSCAGGDGAGDDGDDRSLAVADRPAPGSPGNDSARCGHRNGYAMTEMTGAAANVAHTAVPDRFRAMMSAFPTGVAVVTTTDADGRPHGMTCSSVCSVTLEPPTLLVCLRA